MTSPPIPPLSLAPRAKLAAVRCIATDIDGTVTRNGKLCADVLTAFAALASAGVEVLPVTGRPAGEALGLARYLPHVREAIAENGAVLVRPDQDVVPLWSAPDRDRLLRVAARISEADVPLQLAEDAFCRVGDVAFRRDGREDELLAVLKQRAAAQDVFLVWSSVHVHLSLQEPDKGAAVLQVSADLGYAPEEVLTIGDAPNDVGLWHSGRFGLTVGTSDVLDHLAQLSHTPEWLCDGRGADAWLEMTHRVLAAKGAA